MILFDRGYEPLYKSMQEGSQNVVRESVILFTSDSYLTSLLSLRFDVILLPEYTQIDSQMESIC